MMNIEKINLGPMDNCTYLVTKGSDALLIDPAWDMNFLIHTLEKKQLTLRGVLFTHGHFDHVMGVAELKAQENARVAIHALDASALTDGRSSLAHLGGVLVKKCEVDTLLEDEDRT